MSKSDRETYYITAQKIPKVNIFPCWQHRTTRSLKVRQQRVNLALPVREAQVNKKRVWDWSFSLCCWSRGVTLEIGTGLSWGRLPEWLARRTERPLFGAVCEKVLSQASPHLPLPLNLPHPSSPPIPTFFFFLSCFSLKRHTHTQMLIHTLTHFCLYLPAVPGGKRHWLQLLGG